MGSEYLPSATHLVFEAPNEQDSENENDGLVLQRHGSLRLRYQPGSNTEAINECTASTSVGNDPNNGFEVQTDIIQEPQPIDMQTDDENENVEEMACALPTKATDFSGDLQLKTRENVKIIDETKTSLSSGVRNETKMRVSYDIHSREVPDAVTNGPKVKNMQGTDYPSKVTGKSKRPEPPTSTKFQISVKNFDGKHYTFHVSPTDSVDHLTELIKDKIGIPSEQYSLNFAGKTLVRGKMLQYYGIYENCVVFLLGRLRGG